MIQIIIFNFALCIFIYICRYLSVKMIGANLDVRSMIHGKPSQKSSIQGVFNWSLVQPNNMQPNTQVHQNKKESERQAVINKQNKLAQVVQEYFNKHTKKLRAHQIKNQLYAYDDDIHLKRCRSQQNLSHNQPLLRKEKVKLNLNDEKDRQVIQSRKQKIKQFSRCTRDLPNSAFATYYGKPPFEPYGRCNSNFNLKTHNVMPHRGRNNPNIKQTYQSALKKAKTMKISQHIPRKPIQQFESLQKRNEEKKQKPSRLPLQKPDLINHVRFSEVKTTTDRKEPVPIYQQLKTEIRKRREQIKKKEEKKKKKTSKGSKTTVEEEDGLKFMNTREGLLNIIESKRIKDSRLAYKVTECYPKQAEQLYSKRQTEDDQEDFKPAGLTYKKSQPACNIIYRRYED